MSSIELEGMLREQAARTEIDPVLLARNAVQVMAAELVDEIDTREDKPAGRKLTWLEENAERMHQIIDDEEAGAEINAQALKGNHKLAAELLLEKMEQD